MVWPSGDFDDPPLFCSERHAQENAAGMGICHEMLDFVLDTSATVEANDAAPRVMPAKHMVADPVVPYTVVSNFPIESCERLGGLAVD